MEHEERQSPDIGQATEDRDALVAQLAETFDPLAVVRLMLEIGLRYSDLALALNVHPRTVRAWLESDERDPERHRDAILSLKSVVLFLLRRGILSPREVALWLVEPNEQLGFRRPLAVLTEDEGIHDVVSASATFTRPEPRRKEVSAANKAVAAGATGRRKEVSAANKAVAAGATGRRETSKAQVVIDGEGRAGASGSR